MSDYITDSGNINLKSLKVFIEEMGYHEETLVGEMINK